MSRETSSREATTIAALLSGFPTSSAIDPGAQFHAYRMAVDGLPIEAIENAARAYLQGKVKRDDNRFAPSCAEFAERCRDEANMMAAQRRPRIEPPPAKPEAPKVSKEKMDLLRLAMKGSEGAKSKLRKMGYSI